MERCKTKNLALNVNKTKEIIIHLRRSHTPPLINNTAVERVSSIKFLGAQITETRTWSHHSGALVRRAQQRMHFVLDEESTPPLSNSHHLVQRHYSEPTDQLYLCLARSLQCLWLGVPVEGGE